MKQITARWIVCTATVASLSLVACGGDQSSRDATGDTAAIDAGDIATETGPADTTDTGSVDTGGDATTDTAADTGDPSACGRAECGICELGHCDEETGECDDIDLPELNESAFECDSTLPASTFVYLDPNADVEDPDGSRARPYTSLEAALEAARNRENAYGIVIGGSPDLRRDAPLRLTEQTSLLGGYTGAPDFAPDADQRPVVGGRAFAEADDAIADRARLDIPVGRRSALVVENHPVLLRGIAVREPSTDTEAYPWLRIGVDLRSATGTRLHAVDIRVPDGADGIAGDGEAGGHLGSGPRGHGGTVEKPAFRGYYCNRGARHDGPVRNRCREYADGGLDPSDYGFGGERTKKDDASCPFGATPDSPGKGQNSVVTRVPYEGGRGTRGSDARQVPPADGDGGPADTSITKMDFQTTDDGGRLRLPPGTVGDPGKGGDPGESGGGGSVRNPDELSGTACQYTGYDDNERTDLLFHGGGGAGGFGGCGGQGGGGGMVGGSSVGVAAVATSTVHLEEVTVTVGDGGAGSPGGDGGAGGKGQPGEKGGAGTSQGDCVLAPPANASPSEPIEAGYPGGNGGRGQPGANGGPGAGGASVGILCAGADDQMTQIATDAATSVEIGSAGSGAGSTPDGVAKSRWSCQNDDQNNDD